MPWRVDAHGHTFRASLQTADGLEPRVIVDRAGLEWAVSEVLTPQPWAKGQQCLVLDSGDCVRRIWHYPRYWRALDASALLRLGTEA